MIFENSQDTLILDETTIPLGITKIGIKVSGGLDSALLSFMLAKFVKEERSEIQLFPITGIADNKPYQEIFSKKVLKKIEELLDFKFGTHHICNIRTISPEIYITDQREFTKKLYDENIVEIICAGVTADPTEKEAPQLYVDKKMLPFDDRSKRLTKRLTRKEHFFLPFVNTDKKGIAEHYKKLDLLNTLFPLTRSCEEYTTDFSNHCGKCWWCLERQWGFGRL